MSRNRSGGVVLLDGHLLQKFSEAHFFVRLKFRAIVTAVDLLGGGFAIHGPKLSQYMPRVLGQEEVLVVYGHVK